MNKPKPTVIDANSHAGRTLLALRAGAMSSIELADRFPGGHKLTELTRKGMVEKVDDKYRLTESGRAACPLRNPQASEVRAVPDGAKAARSTTFQPLSHGEKTMPNQRHETSIAKVRRMLAESPEGVARKDLIQRTGLEATRIDNAIFNLIRLGEAYRPGYGVIALVKDRISLAPATPSMAKNPVRPVDRQTVRAEPMPVAPSNPATRRNDSPDIEAEIVDFSIHADGKLTITTEFDGTISLSATETVRLHSFLSRINPAVLQPSTN